MNTHYGMGEALGGNPKGYGGAEVTDTQIQRLLRPCTPRQRDVRREARALAGR